MKKLFVTKNPYLIFLPFLLLYIAIILFLPTDGKFGDETYYLKFAHNIINGFYSPSAPDVDLMYGPGYPIIIAPFIALNLPLIYITLLNAALYYFSIILLFKSLLLVVNFRIAVITSLFWALYYHSFEQLHLIYTETITSFLISLIIYCTIKTFSPDNTRNTNKLIIIAGFALGYVALTKVIFGYVLICMLIGSGIIYLKNRNSVNYRKGLFILLIAIATTLPYLIYTYHLTGRILYWGTSGGTNLYWMSSPYPRENGDWYNFDKLESNYINNYEYSSMPGRFDSIRVNHLKDREDLYKFKGVEQDDLYRKIAIQNIKSHPLKFLQNCISNVGRFFFNYPKSYVLQRPINLIRLPLNGTLILILSFCSIPTVISWYRIVYPIRFMIFIALLYMGGSILGSTEPRMFSVIVPILLIWIAYIYQKSVKIKWKFD
jgi:hypothetical protein